MKKQKLQVENGNFTRIINVVLEKLALFPFPAKTGMPMRLILYVIRKTWGYHKKEDIISLTQFEKALNTNRPSVVHWLKYLVKANQPKRAIYMDLISIMNNGNGGLKQRN